jgi:hypothetical protein
MEFRSCGSGISPKGSCVKTLGPQLMLLGGSENLEVKCNWKK